MDRKEYQKQYYLLNKEKISKKHREYYLLNSEVCKRNSKDRQSRSPEKIREYNRKWRKLNPEKVALANKRKYIKYREEISVKAKLYHSSDRARDRYLQNKYGITLKDYEKKFKEQGGVCFLCKQKSAKNLSVDHVHFPVGTKRPSENCTADRVRGLLCNTCNRLILGAIERRKAVPARTIIEALYAYAQLYPLRGEK